MNRTQRNRLSRAKVEHVEARAKARWIGFITVGLMDGMILPKGSMVDRCSLTARVPRKNKVIEIQPRR